jgi:Tfp pilus assembly protein PilW
MGIAMNARSGFTLIELLVSVASSLLILAAVGGFSRAESRLVDRELRRLRVREANRRVLEMIVREVRGAGFAPVPSGSFDGALDGLAVAARDRIEIRSDLHGATTADPSDGILDADSDERIGFFVSMTRGTVSESVGRQTLPLTVDSTVPAGGLVFRYIDACGDEILPVFGTDLSVDERARVRSIAVGLTIKEGAESAGDEVVIELRNRRRLRCP